MLTIRAAQMAVLEQELFYLWITGYLEKSYPWQTANLGWPSLRKLVVDAVQGARNRGYESSDSILQYAHARFLLGGDLETLQELAWARQILDNVDEPLQSERLAILEEAIIARLESTPLVRRAGG